MIYNDNQLYMTAFDKHHETKPMNSDDILYNLNLYALFWDQILVSDATINNNDQFRKFLTIESSGELLIKDEIAEYFHNEIISPVVRGDFDSFTKLRDEQITGHSKPPDPPSEEYVFQIDKLLKDKIEMYKREKINIFNGKDVGELFKKNLIDNISSEKYIENVKRSRRCDQEYITMLRSMGKRIWEYCQGAKVLYADLLDEIIENTENSVKEVMHNFVSDCYLHNVPIILKKEYCAFNNRYNSIFGDQGVDSENSRHFKKITKVGASGFNGDNIKNLTADELFDIKKASEYLQLQKAIRDLDMSKKPEYAFADLVEAVEVYFWRLSRELNEKAKKIKKLNENDVFYMTLTLYNDPKDVEHCMYWTMKKSNSALQNDKNITIPDVKICKVCKQVGIYDKNIDFISVQSKRNEIR